MIQGYINILELEMTRRCNSNCLHCMRGKAQNVDMSQETISNIFHKDNYKIVGIGKMILTGGEVFLNKEGMLYLLNYVLENHISIEDLVIITNSLIYNEEIINLLKKLAETGTNIALNSYVDQFHKDVPFSNLAKLKELPFYTYQKSMLLENDIIALGKAAENNIGNILKADLIKNKFANVSPHVSIDWISKYFISFKSLYVTATGNFGSKPTDASWDMIDSKYYLNINENSLFTNCEFGEVFQMLLLNYQQIASEFSLPEELLQDLEIANQEGNLELFVSNLTDNKLAEYFSIKSLERKLK